LFTIITVNEQETMFILVHTCNYQWWLLWTTM